MTRRGVDFGILILAALVVLLGSFASPALQALAHPGSGRVKAPRRDLALVAIRRASQSCVVHVPRVDRPSPVGLKVESEVRAEVDPTEETSSALPRLDVITSSRRRANCVATRPAEAVAARPLRC